MTQSADLLKRPKERKDRRTHPIFNRYWYRFSSRRLSDENTLFLNWGYEEDPPMAVPLAESDEPTGTKFSFTTAWRARWISPANGCWRLVAGTAAGPLT